MKQRFGGAHLRAWGLLGCPEWRVGQHIISKCLGQLGRALNSVAMANAKALLSGREVDLPLCLHFGAGVSRDW